MEAPKQRVRGTITPERMLKMEQEKIIEDKKKKSENNKKYLANKKKKERLKKRDPELYNVLYPDMPSSSSTSDTKGWCAISVSSDTIPWELLQF